MAKEVDVLTYLPNILREIKEFRAIATVENPVLEGLWKRIDNILDNRFILTSNEEGLGRREKMLKLRVPATDTLETRRFRIMSLYQERAPYTNKVLRELLDSLLGRGQYSLTRDVANKTLSIKIELTVRGQFDAVVVMLERITPQNMELIIELRYNQHSKLAQHTHAQLAGYSHEQLREVTL